MPVVQGDLFRTKTHEADETWPDRIEIVAYFGNRSRSVQIEADAFYGRNGYNAPLSGDQVIRMIDHLRKLPQKKDAK